jgi:hypothetical protein
MAFWLHEAQRRCVALVSSRSHAFLQCAGALDDADATGHMAMCWLIIDPSAARSTRDVSDQELFSSE